MQSPCISVYPNEEERASYIVSVEVAGSHNQYGIIEWMIKIKRQKDLIKSGERVIRVK